MPYPKLVTHMRDALATIATKASQLEEYWDHQRQRSGRPNTLKDTRMQTNRSRVKQFPQRLHEKAAEKAEELSEQTRHGRRRAAEAQPKASKREVAKQQKVADFFDGLSVEASKAAVSQLFAPDIK